MQTPAGARGTRATGGPSAGRGTPPPPSPLTRGRVTLIASRTNSGGLCGCTVRSRASLAGTARVRTKSTGGRGQARDATQATTPASSRNGVSLAPPAGRRRYLGMNASMAVSTAIVVGSSASVTRRVSGWSPCAFDDVAAGDSYEGSRWEASSSRDHPASPAPPSDDAGLSGASSKSSALLADAWNSRLWRPTKRLTRGEPWRGLDGSVADLPDGPLRGLPLNSCFGCDGQVSRGIHDAGVPVPRYLAILADRPESARVR